MDLIKLKIEHSRYKEALASIGLADSIVFARKHAFEALNPPPPPPVTLQGILDKLEKLDRLDESSHYVSFHSIELFSDGSGSLRRGDKDILSRFDNLKSIVWDVNT